MKESRGNILSDLVYATVLQLLGCHRTATQDCWTVLHTKHLLGPNPKLRLFDPKDTGELLELASNQHWMCVAALV